MPIISITFHGAARTVTGSCALVQCGKINILVDCGMAQDSATGQSGSFPFDPATIDAVIMTHGHLDHSGRIPELVENGFTGTIYGHYASVDIAKIIWNDSAKFQECTFSAAAIEKTQSHLFPIGYGVPIEIAGCTFRLHDAGHILGSSHIEMELGDKRILFSGDIGANATPIIRDPHTNWEQPFDAVVIESTYGNRMHESRAATLNTFEALIKRTVSENGVLLIPAFAIGRTQEILYHLNTMVESGAVAPVPVFIDSPMASKVTSIYRRNRDCYDSETNALIESGDMPLEFAGLRFVESNDESCALAQTSKPCIIVAGSGMCNGGRILRHLATFGRYSSTTVMFCGFQAQGSTGRQLINGAQEIVYENKRVPINAAVASLHGFSAHADRAGLLAWAAKIPAPPQSPPLWLVNHGEPEASESLARALHQMSSAPAIAVAYNQTITV